MRFNAWPLNAVTSVDCVDEWMGFDGPMPLLPPPPFLPMMGMPPPPPPHPHHHPGAAPAGPPGVPTVMMPPGPVMGPPEAMGAFNPAGQNGIFDNFMMPYNVSPNCSLGFSNPYTH